MPRENPSPRTFKGTGEYQLVVGMINKASAGTIGKNHQNLTFALQAHAPARIFFLAFSFKSTKVILVMLK